MNEETTPAENPNVNRNDVALVDAPATVDSKPVLKVLQQTISDNPQENSFTVLLDDGSKAVVPQTDFVAGAAVETVPVAEVAPEAPQTEAPITPAEPENPSVAQSNTPEVQ